MEENRNYESPRFEFSEMQLLERLAAASCWSAKFVWIEQNGQSGWQEGEPKFTGAGAGGSAATGCGQLASQIGDWLNSNGVAYSAENVKNDVINPPTQLKVSGS